MKALSSLALKALRMGPLPYLGLAVAVIATGAVLQLRGGATAEFADGRTLFGTFAQIGGCIGLFGLMTMVLRGLPPEGPRGMDVPHSARAARMEGADPGSRARPQRAAASEAQMSSGPAARAGMRMARQMGLQAIRQLATRKG